MVLAFALALTAAPSQATLNSITDWVGCTMLHALEMRERTDPPDVIAAAVEAACRSEEGRVEANTIRDFGAREAAIEMADHRTAIRRHILERLAHLRGTAPARQGVDVDYGRCIAQAAADRANTDLDPETIADQTLTACAAEENAVRADILRGPNAAHADDMMVSFRRLVRGRAILLVNTIRERRQ